MGIVILWALSMLKITGIPLNPQVLRLARLARFLRFVRLVQSFQVLDSIFTLTTAIKQSVSVLGWASILLVGIHWMIALLANQYLHAGYFLDQAVPVEERHAVYIYFGTVTRSLMSMFELTLANWPPVARQLSEKVSEWFMLLSVLYKLTMGFAVVGVINGVIMQETFKAAAADDRLMMRQKQRSMKTHAKKMGMLFKQADPGSTGRVDQDTFRSLMSNAAVKVWLASMELDASDADKLFRLLDDGDGLLSADELVQGVARLKGHARSIDLFALTYEQKILQRTLNEGLEIFSDLASKLGMRSAVPHDAPWSETQHQVPGHHTVNVFDSGDTPSQFSKRCSDVRAVLAEPCGKGDTHFHVDTGIGGTGNDMLSCRRTSSSESFSGQCARPSS